MEEEKEVGGRTKRYKSAVQDDTSQRGGNIFRTGIYASDKNSISLCLLSPDFCLLIDNISEISPRL